ncbi:LysE family translocator [Elstera litoralis]|uniref:LysE family translocator n=1 Tax=Elstera litoralis TaxID=552518 RepID=UPI000A8D4961|nr:LysE family translocator [Elstera litoralis]
MVAAVGFGAGELFDRIPHLHDILRVVATAYLLYLAWKIAHSAPMAGEAAAGDGNRKPFSFLQAAAFQWVNPKAWVMAIGAISTYALPEAFSLSVIVIALSFLIVGSPCIACWAGFGSLMRRLMSDPRRVRQINIGMAALLVASALYPLIAAMG